MLLAENISSWPLTVPWKLGRNGKEYHSKRSKYNIKKEKKKLSS